MIFTSLQFVLFFSIVFILHQITPCRFKWVTLLVASYCFYGFYKITYLPLLIVPTLLIFFIAIRIDNQADKKKKKRLFLLGIFIALFGLIFFKYINFLGSTIFSIGKLFQPSIHFKPIELIWPIGISFYLFKLLSYLIDVYKGNGSSERHLGYFALYVASFPQLLAGPIDRARQFIPELKQRVVFNLDRVLDGLRQVLLGVFKKMVISDRLALFVNEVFSKPEDYQGLTLIIGAYFFAFQIYCDFSGYSDMAIGLSRMLGYRSMKNFNFPYFSKNLTQFWNGWHISLSTWLRDYLFLPIAYAVMNRIEGTRKMGIKVETWGYIVGMFITMFLGGLWHGPTWTMVIWGSIHGIFLSFGYLTKKWRKKLYKLSGISRIKGLKIFISTFITFNLVTFAWIFFRAENIQKAMLYIGNIGISFNPKGMGYLLFNSLLVLIFIFFEYIYSRNEGRQWQLPPVIKLAGYAFVVCIVIILAVDQSNEFIYFQF